MISKSGDHPWNSRKSPGESPGGTGGDQRRPSGIWSEFGKQRGISGGKEVESWPKLGESRTRNKHAGHRKSDSVYQMGYVVGSNMPPDPVQGPSSIPKEEQQFSWSTRRNKCSISPPCQKLVISPRKAESDQESQQTSLANCDQFSLSSKEEKNLAFKKLCKEKKEELKAEKRRKKEVETLRKMLGPKGVKVTVIDNKVFSKILDQGEDQSRSPQCAPRASEVQLDSSSFPALRRSEKLGIKVNASRPQETRNSESVGNNDSKPVSGDLSVANKLDASPPKSTKSKRRRDPVVVDIWKAIEICQAGKKLEGEEQEEEGIVRASKPKEKYRVSGNILDGSNPLRHRGKKREIPKKRNETRLKKAILAERKRRREARGGVVKTHTIDNITSNENEMPNVSNNASALVSDVNHLCSPVEVPEGSKLLAAANEVKKEREEPVEKCLMEPHNNSLNAVDVDKKVIEKLHSRNYREYCNHSKSADLTEAVKMLLKDILKFQDRLYATQPIKAESHRRYVVGLRQTHHLLAVRKVKIVILAQDLEKVPSPGGLDDVVNTIITLANEQNVPVVFPLTRRQLGKVTYRKVGVSCVGVLNYQGSEENFRKMMSCMENSRKEYEERFHEEKCRLMSELGLLTIKKEEDGDTINQNQSQPCPAGCAETLPLLQKITEAIAEFSLVSASQKVVKNELCDDGCAVILHN